MANGTANGTVMRQTRGRDALRDVANLVGGALMTYLLTGAVLRLLAGWLFKAFSKDATLANPVNVPEWLTALTQLALAACALLAALQFLRHMTPATLRPHLQITDLKDRRLWLFLPVFLGLGVLCSMLTTVLQGAFEKQGWHTPGPSALLPENGFALFIAFCTMCIVPAVLEELLCRGMIQGMLRPWGAGFAIVMSSVLFTLLHSDFSRMPGIFLLSLCLGAVAFATDSLMPGMVLHFLNNTMAFLLLYIEQTQKDASGLGLAVYLLCGFIFAALVCVYFINKWNMLAELRRPMRMKKARQPHAGKQGNRMRRMVHAPLLVVVVLWLVAWAIIPAVLPRDDAALAAKTPVSATSNKTQSKSTVQPASRSTPVSGAPSAPASTSGSQSTSQPAA